MVKEDNYIYLFKNRTYTLLCEAYVIIIGICIYVFYFAIDTHILYTNKNSLGTLVSA